MSRSALPYHKGNLREKILREAARLISTDGVDAVSMRKLSEQLGISRMAAYHHFENKDDLLAAVGQDGFRQLSERLQEAGAANLTALDALRAALAAYVRFALDETEFFRLMFGRRAAEARPERCDGGAAPVRILKPGGVRGFRCPGISSEARAGRGRHQGRRSAVGGEHSLGVRTRRRFAGRRRSPQDAMPLGAVLTRRSGRAAPRARAYWINPSLCSVASGSAPSNLLIAAFSRPFSSATPYGASRNWNTFLSF